MNRTLTLLACTALVLGAIAVPVMAHDGDEAHDERHAAADEKHDQKAADNASADERRQGAEDRRAGAMERRQAHDDRKADAMERRDAMRDEIKERQEAFHAARDACKAAAKDRNSTENGTGNHTAPGRCISMAAHDHHAKVARAAHYEGKMIAAIEKRLDRLQSLEDRVQARLDSGDLNETELADAEAKLVRIDAAQEKLEAKLAALKDSQEAHEAEAAEPAAASEPEPSDDASGNVTAAPGNETAEA